MIRPFFFHLILAGFLGSCIFSPEISPAQSFGSISSEHVRVRMPTEREALGRDTIADIELCYAFMNRATGENLPRKLLLDISWDKSDSVCNWREGSIQLGMNQPAAAANSQAFLLHHAAREMARMGLLELSQGAEREDTEFLFEGMVKILVHEYEHSSRNLESAWVISRLLDEMQMLGLTTQRAWSKFSGGRRCLRSAAPGITFLMTFRELLGRDRPLKLFESLRKTGLNQSLAAAFRAPVSELENVWLKKVREYRNADEITVATDEVPQLLQTELHPGTVQPGAMLTLRFFLKDTAGNLLPDGVFVKDERTGRLGQAQAVSEKESDYMMATIPVEANCAPGQYNYQLTVIDESGNLRNWTGTYTVVAP
jgi:hypothetical protein